MVVMEKKSSASHNKKSLNSVQSWKFFYRDEEIFQYYLEQKKILNKKQAKKGRKIIKQQNLPPPFLQNSKKAQKVGPDGCRSVRSDG
ncbi:hypothetical protein BpHYR1_009198 [Brachionus plicatilis]|uniref:Uncharacterized protein n=1 Tax=Brachionus plicatilis TaxID=10195 RepID=A0A3M7PDU7_BRAPC|nr:hypothetical protein BpHYR1_009198 [Brachionus plicatilis]